MEMNLWGGKNLKMKLLILYGNKAKSVFEYPGKTFIFSQPKV